ncbi:polyprenyl synthetase family protein [Methanomassiliicoccales archaeon LGM-RCC1]|nr:polyprenyl synthetase family protein [Methanomassiliicoccales archaeon LGM-RCC1]
MAEGSRGWQDVISDDLVEVSKIMREATRDGNAEVQEVMDYALDSPGKLIRPSMVLLVCNACGKKPDIHAKKYAAAAELAHMATLIHDDINDESENRRGKLATYRKYGVRKALTTGDVMLVKAMSLFDSNPQLLQSIIDMGSSLADSEFLQYNHKFDLDILEQEYYQVISGKTAAFLAECAKTGAIAAGASDELIEEMGRFGQLYGMAFQIADDLIDLFGSEKVSGKTAMRDLSEGVITLPTILAIRDVKIGNKIRGKIKKGASLDEIRDMILQTEAVDDCKLIIKDYVDEAVDCLSVIPDSEYKTSLIQLAELNLNRLS